MDDGLHTVLHYAKNKLEQDKARLSGFLPGCEDARKRDTDALLAMVEKLLGEGAHPERDHCTDPLNWQQYAKEGETAQACIERHRREQDSLFKLLAQAREPLTDQQIIALLPVGWTGMLAQVMEFARRIERARTAGVAPAQPNGGERG